MYNMIFYLELLCFLILLLVGSELYVQYDILFRVAVFSYPTPHFEMEAVTML